ncbi:MAG: hypothetical protein WC943_17510, partial [Elusimicrobiota bacterium]
MNIKIWSAEFDAPYDGDLQEFLDAIERHPKSGKGYDFGRYFAEEVSQVGWRLARQPAFLDRLLALLQAIPAGDLKLKLFEAAASKLSPRIPADQARSLLADWQTALSAVGRSHAGRVHIEKGAFGGHRQRLTVVFQRVDDQIEKAEKELGI